MPDTVPIESIPHVVALRSILAGRKDFSGWDEVWKQNITPWDVGEAQPPLRNLIESKRLPLPTNGRALVPGCGRAYDALVIASTLGLDTTAIDISPTAVTAARGVLASVSSDGKEKVSIKEADFFAPVGEEDPRYDLIYDYTFFVAIPPAMRLSWGRQMSALANPGAYLITLVYPLGLDPEGGGPPHFVLPEHYDGPLQGWTKVISELPEVTRPSHVGKDFLMVWRKD
ncbi:S-adenosyl-L-methionine-dependent methyltransferase [Gloeopeniophorella convolvens]|nr:S-adenosyl-L-methionine-dependent methyltransferase [Gloeopeniophorella convolvens]